MSREEYTYIYKQQLNVSDLSYICILESNAL